MLKILSILLLITNLLYANALDKKIEDKKSSLNKNKSNINKTEIKMQSLAKQINLQNGGLNKLEKEIKLINKDIDEHQAMLLNSKGNLSKLSIKGKLLKKKKKNYESDIIDTIIEDYSASIAIKLANENSLDELINSEVYNLLADEAKDKILKIDNEYMNLSQNSKDNKREISKLNTYIEQRQKKKKVLNYLISKHTKSLSNLEEKHKEYQKELKNIIKKQQSLSSLLGDLNILKVKEITKEKERKKAQEEKKKRLLLALKKKREEEKEREKSKPEQVNKTQQSVQESYATDIDLDVRILGSSTKGIKISKYRGSKTIAPLKSFKIIKKFGKYYDPIYKIQLFNESIVLKTETPKSKVYSVLNGKIVYAKNNAGMLENVVIIQHNNGLHTIYSHLDEISPTLKVGKWIKKGYVVGRVDNLLTFQATKNNSHINPEDLFKR